MIYLYTGKTGSGKTFQMIKDVYPQWLKGRDVYSNTKLFYEKFGGKANSKIENNPENFTIWEKYVLNMGFKWLCKLFNWKFRPIRRGKIIYFDDISELIEIKDGIILMDEAQNLLDARNWENLPMEFSNKLRQHRKHNVDLYATTQNMGTIDINMRRLVQKWSHCKDVFALLWLRNPSLFTIHVRQYKDIDMLYNQVDDLLVDTIKWNFFFIHRWKRRYYDTLWDIGFNFYKTIWLQHNNRKIALIIPKNWNLTKVRTQLLLQKHFLDLNKSNNSSLNKEKSENANNYEKKDVEQRTGCLIVTEHKFRPNDIKFKKEKMELLRKRYSNMD